MTVQPHSQKGGSFLQSSMFVQNELYYFLTLVHSSLKIYYTMFCFKSSYSTIGVQVFHLTPASNGFTTDRKVSLKKIIFHCLLEYISCYPYGLLSI